MLLYCFACVFNVALDLITTYMVAYRINVGLRMKTYDGREKGKNGETEDLGRSLKFAKNDELRGKEPYFGGHQLRNLKVWSGLELFCDPSFLVKMMERLTQQSLVVLKRITFQ